jgi:hypothetical protein
MKALELAVVDERAQRYLRATPASPADVPEGRVVVHNAVFPTGRRLNENGFRAWLQIPSERLEVCPCKWAPQLGEHYRVARCMEIGVGDVCVSGSNLCVCVRQEELSGQVRTPAAGALGCVARNAPPCPRQARGSGRHAKVWRVGVARAVCIAPAG